MRTLVSILCILFATLPRPAQAECTAAYPLQNMARDLGVMQSSLRNLDEAEFRGSGMRLKLGMPCMEAPAPAAVYATAYRLLGALYHLEGDAVQAEAWFHTAIELDPAFAWDVRDFDVGHPIRVSYETIGDNLDNTMATVQGQELRLPSTGRLLVDGRPLMEAEATMGRPHVIQQVSGDNRVTATWVVEGNAFPAALLQPFGSGGSRDEGPSLVIGDAPAENSGKDKSKDRRKDRGKDDVQASSSQTGSLGDVVVVERIRPPMKTPLLIIGGVGVLGAGGTYAASYLMHQRFQEATTTEEANQLRTTTNALVIASGGAALAGLGLGYWGVLLDGGAGFGIHGQF